MDITMEQKKQYQKRVEQVCPQTNLLTGCLKAFVVGGLICVLGQMINTWIMNFGADRQLAATWTSISLIFLGSFLTGAGWYDNLGKFAGAGSIIPITGFANGIVSSAIEFKKEGFILGLGAKMFTIAGPVLVYGVLASAIVGLISYFVG
ncbi:stage V sporulation protein AC [Bianquea renquensis]|jgi:stage V sporulation protein AC|uniref:Stage V sporulation protein AC n=1 Tax=Bianquea renquensis TaxID=2763661 RepID=A0A926DQQ6_9FIRM|nr:stage V sporulation protein AC [Bianquea renquensis]MBC8542308.1 stage V sporulation protein AC [Bianquea renquensis]